MKKKLVALCTCLAIIGMAGMAQATLTTIGTATYNGTDYKLIWDDDNNGNSVIWLDYTNDPTGWSLQTAWAAGLDGLLTYNINPDYTVSWDGDWRLGSTVDGAYEWGYDGTTTAGYNITSSEMGHLFYEELGNLGYADIHGNFPQSGWGLDNTGDFDNLIASWYWSGTVDSNTNFDVWFFHMGSGVQDQYALYYGGCGLALRSGQVSAANPVPEPATMLLFSTGLVGLAGYRLKRKGKSA